MDINNIILYSFLGFAVMLVILIDVLFGKMHKFEITKENPDIRILFGISAIGGIFGLVFIGSLVTKFIKIFNIIN